MIECNVYLHNNSLNSGLGSKEESSIFEWQNYSMLNNSDYEDSLNHSRIKSGNISESERIYEAIESIIYSRIIVVICIFGILGNILNLLVLTRKRMLKSMDRMERSAHAGLTALAVSDMLFCFALLPNAWVDLKGFQYLSKNFQLYYKIYSEGTINIFIMSSTWLTVTMATSRYLAICHPIRAREIIGMTFAKASIVTVFAVCIVFNLPHFWNEHVDSLRCIEGYNVYFPAPGFLKKNLTFRLIYYWCYFSLAILIPLIILAFCNSFLIKTLRKSSEMRQKYSSGSLPPESTHKITLTLIIIVVLYIVLVTPAEVIKFFMTMVIDNASITHSYNLGLAFVNALQSINFAFNFILYCTINVHFRSTTRELFCSTFSRKNVVPERNRYDSMTATTHIYGRHAITSEF